MQADIKKCQIHPDQSIQYICFDQKCINSLKLSQILCQKCTLQHNLQCKDHRVVQYQLFKKYLQSLRKQIEYDELKQIIKEYVCFLYIHFSQFTMLKKDVHNYLQKLQDEMLASISLDFKQQHQFQIFQGQISLLTKNKLFKKYVTNPSSLNLIKQQSKLSNMHTLKQVRKMRQQIAKLIENVKKEVYSPKIQKNFFFSSKFKHQNIQILNNGLSIRRINKQDLGHSQLAVCGQNFTPINNQVQFLIKDMTNRGCIALGACMLEKVQQLKYFKCWQLGQGAYSLFTNTFGFVKCNHHTNKSYSNAFVKKWKIRKGDVVKVMIDFMNQKIIFQKNQDEFSMPIDLQIGKLYPFAALSYYQDQVQIV